MITYGSNKDSAGQKNKPYGSMEDSVLNMSFKR